MSTVVYTTFAGRKNNLEIQFKYLNKLLQSGEISEVHLWDYTREIADSIWLKYSTNSVEPLTYRAAKHEFRLLPLLSNFGNSKLNHLKFGIRAKHDAHILLYKDQSTYYEIVLGGWNNTKSVIRTSGDVVSEYNGKIFNNMEWVQCDISCYHNTLEISCDGKTILSTSFGAYDFNVLLAGFTMCSVDYDLMPLKEKLNVNFDIQVLDPSKYKLMEAKNKWTWVDYYAHYTMERYPNHVIIKADDDIVFIDIDGFKTFINNRINDTDSLYTFPSIINNGVCAYYQQKMGLIPTNVGTFPYDTFQGELWSRSELCTRIHKHFIQSHQAFLNVSKQMPRIQHPCGDRISINFFAVLSKDLNTFQEIIPLTNNGSLDDELHLSITMAKKYNRRHVVDQSMVVAHLSFYKQIETGLQSDLMLQLYDNLSKLYTL